MPWPSPGAANTADASNTVHAEAQGPNFRFKSNIGCVTRLVFLMVKNGSPVRLNEAAEVNDTVRRPEPPIHQKLSFNAN